MPRPPSKQISLRLPPPWYEQLKNLSHEWTSLEGKLVSPQDLIRECIDMSFGALSRELKQKKMELGTKTNFASSY